MPRSTPILSAAAVLFRTPSSPSQGGSFTRKFVSNRAVAVILWEKGSNDGEPLEGQGADSEKVHKGFSPESMKLLATLPLYPYLSTRVKTVCVGLYYDAPSSPAYSPAVLVGTVLRMCRNVVALELEGDFQKDVLWETMSAIRPNLQTLFFHKDCYIQDEKLDFLALFPALEELGFEGEISAAATPSDLRPPFRLKTLYLPDQLPDEILEFLVSISAHSLTKPDCTSTHPNPDTLATLSSLRTLELKLQYEDGWGRVPSPRAVNKQVFAAGERLARQLDSVPNLHHLRLTYGYHLWPQPLLTGHRILDYLPSSLRSLRSLRSPLDISPAYLLSFLLDPANFPPLRTFAL